MITQKEIAEFKEQKANYVTKKEFSDMVRKLMSTFNTELQQLKKEILENKRY